MIGSRSLDVRAAAVARRIAAERNGRLVMVPHCEVYEMDAAVAAGDDATVELLDKRWERRWVFGVRERCVDQKQDETFLEERPVCDCLARVLDSDDLTGYAVSVERCSDRRRAPGVIPVLGEDGEPLAAIRSWITLADTLPGHVIWDAAQVLHDNSEATVAGWIEAEKRRREEEARAAEAAAAERERERAAAAVEPVPARSQPVSPPERSLRVIEGGRKSEQPGGSLPRFGSGDGRRTKRWYDPPDGWSRW